MFTKIKKTVAGKKIEIKNTYFIFTLPIKLLRKKIKMKLDKTNPSD
tara:strand:+ start:307 stop:444 length:138 start_codon:yes stop_codon:yes gene_type:complete